MTVATTGAPVPSSSVTEPLLTVLGLSGSSKVAVTLADSATPVAPRLGETLRTRGALRVRAGRPG